MKHIFFLFLTVLAFWHCQAPTPAPKNILHCYARFDAAGRKMKAEAILQDSRNKQIIQLPGGVRFQATEMKVLPVRGITYSTEFQAKYTPEVVFDWKNSEGVRGEFKLKVPSIDSFFFSSKVLSVKSSADLQWVGKALEKGETLVFIWENAADGKTVPMEVSTTLGAPLIEIPAAKFSELGPGNWSIYLVRKHPGKTETTDFIIESEAEYYTKPILVRIEA